MDQYLCVSFVFSFSDVSPVWAAEMTNMVDAWEVEDEGTPVVSLKLGHGTGSDVSISSHCVLEAVSICATQEPGLEIPYRKVEG